MVQVLKEEIRLATLRAAQVEFMQNGYLSASIKRIAAKVGISVGNLYRYYAGKEALFDSIVDPVYKELERLIQSHSDQSQGEGDMVQLVANALTKIIKEYRIPLLILIDGSKGTRHENVVVKFYEIMAGNIANHLVSYNSKQGREVFTEQAAWPVSVAFMQGYFEIIRRHPHIQESQQLLRQYVSFWYQGLQAFI